MRLGFPHVFSFSSQSSHSSLCSSVPYLLSTRDGSLSGSEESLPFYQLSSSSQQVSIFKELCASSLTSQKLSLTLKLVQPSWLNVRYDLHRTSTWAHTLFSFMPVFSLESQHIRTLQGSQISSQEFGLEFRLRRKKSRNVVLLMNQKSVSYKLEGRCLLERNASGIRFSLLGYLSIMRTYLQLC